jgi:hypothetical protein
MADHSSSSSLILPGEGSDTVEVISTSKVYSKADTGSHNNYLLNEENMYIDNYGNIAKNGTIIIYVNDVTKLADRTKLESIVKGLPYKIFSRRYYKTPIQEFFEYTIPNYITLENIYQPTRQIRHESHLCQAIDLSSILYQNIYTYSITRTMWKRCGRNKESENDYCTIHKSLCDTSASVNKYWKNTVIHGHIESIISTDLSNNINLFVKNIPDDSRNHVCFMVLIMKRAIIMNIHSKIKNIYYHLLILLLSFELLAMMRLTRRNICYSTLSLDSNYSHNAYVLNCQIMGSMIFGLNRMRVLRYNLGPVYIERLLHDLDNNPQSYLDLFQESDLIVDLTIPSLLKYENYDSNSDIIVYNLYYTIKEYYIDHNVKDNVEKCNNMLHSIIEDSTISDSYDDDP